MKARLVPPMLLATALLAGCGGGGSSISTASLTANDVAVVGPEHITKADFAAALDQEKQSLKAEGRAFPKAGSTDYATVKDEVMSVLVQGAEYEAEAAKLGVTVTNKQIATELQQIKTQYFKGSEATYEAGIKKQGFTDAEVHNQIRQSLLQQGIYTKVTTDATVSNADIKTYYSQHTSDYQTPESRAVQEILVGKKTKTVADPEGLANQLISQLKGGGSFAALAKQYSQDPGSKDSAGKFTAKKGSDVAEFDAAVFSSSLKTGDFAPATNTSQYGWFVIKAVGPIVAAKNQPESQVASTIKQTLLSQKKNDEVSAWAQNIAKSFCTGSHIKYQAGYTPSTDPCASVTVSNTVTT